MPRESIVVVGAGIIGASIAYHLAKRGAKVMVIEASQPAAGASGKSFGWINATFSKRPRHYFDFNVQAIADWHRLQQELDGEPTVHWGGSVAWCPPGVESIDLQRSVLGHQQWGYAARFVDDSELHRLLPAVSPGEFDAACYCADEGAVDPVDTLSVLLRKAKKLGAEMLCPLEVTGLDLSGGGLRGVHTSEGLVQAGALVLACGVQIPPIAKLAGVRVPLKDSPGVLIHTTPLPKLIDRVVLAPGVHFKQCADGRIVAGGQVVAGAGTASMHAGELQAEEIFEKARRFLPVLAGASLDHTTLGYRVMPEDEYPILGFSAQCANLYIAATHSGVALAPLIGRLAAMEILDGAQVSLLEPYRPSRFDL
ncbi:MAG TPA: FAD-dependent oxidoreductase [Bryobacteraceae bacterium]|nr:FAD-dependent oxidoreductase [Bryobacteraceae bacterium]